MRPIRQSIILAVSQCFVFVALFYMVGCSGSLVPTPVIDAAAITGNWQVTSTAPVATKLSSLSGALTGTNATVTGIFHSNSTSACVSPATAIVLTGKADASNNITLTGNLDGGMLTIKGNLATDGKSLTEAVYNVTGGSCAFSAQATATAQSYSSVTGTYSGALSDATGPVISISGALTQTPNSDTDGNFQVSGTGTFPDNSCFSSPVSISNSQVTGGSFSITYTDAVKGNSVAVSGTFSPDANTLSITNWNLTGNCGADSGTGVFTRQQ